MFPMPNLLILLTVLLITALRGVVGVAEGGCLITHKKVCEVLVVRRGGINFKHTIRTTLGEYTFIRPIY